MAYIKLSKSLADIPDEQATIEDKAPNKTIMIFLEGTIFKTRFILHRFSIKGYKPIGNCVNIINGWIKQGAPICYCTYLNEKRLSFVLEVLKAYGLKGDHLYYRSKGEKYKDLVEAIRPDVLIEDDCKSIGGAWQMCITYVKPEIKEKIKSIVIPEYKGIDNLPEDVTKL